jgi:hypothetical protein
MLTRGTGGNKGAFSTGGCLIDGCNDGPGGNAGYLEGVTTNTRVTVKELRDNPFAFLVLRQAPRPLFFLKGLSTPVLGAMPLLWRRRRRRLAAFVPRPPSLPPALLLVLLPALRQCLQQIHGKITDRRVAPHVRRRPPAAATAATTAAPTTAGGVVRRPLPRSAILVIRGGRRAGGGGSGGGRGSEGGRA